MKYAAILSLTVISLAIAYTHFNSNEEELSVLGTNHQESHDRLELAPQQQTIEKALPESHLPSISNEEAALTLLPPPPQEGEGDYQADIDIILNSSEYNDEAQAALDRLEFTLPFSECEPLINKFSSVTDEKLKLGILNILRYSMDRLRPQNFSNQELQALGQYAEAIGSLYESESLNPNLSIDYREKVIRGFASVGDPEAVARTLAKVADEGWINTSNILRIWTVTAFRNDDAYTKLSPGLYTALNNATDEERKSANFYINDILTNYPRSEPDPKLAEYVLSQRPLPENYGDSGRWFTDTYFWLGGMSGLDQSSPQDKPLIERLAYTALKLNSPSDIAVIAMHDGKYELSETTREALRTRLEEALNHPNPTSPLFESAAISLGLEHLSSGYDD